MSWHRLSTPLAPCHSALLVSYWTSSFSWLATTDGSRAQRNRPLRSLDVMSSMAATLAFSQTRGIDAIFVSLGPK